MKYQVLTIPPFDKQFKRLLKKYPSLKGEITQLAISLQTEPKSGIAIGNDCYKIRLAIRSKGKGRSGGARVITYVQLVKHSLYLIAIYDKSELPTLNSQEINALLKQIE
jgi:hypothetical protein